MNRTDNHTQIIERVEQVRERTRLTRTRFCAAFGMKPQTYSNFLGNQHSKPNVHLIMGVCESYNVNPEWLLFGRGSMYRELGGVYHGPGPDVEDRLHALERRVSLLEAAVLDQGDDGEAAEPVSANGGGS